MYLDGFVTGPHPGPDNGLGTGGEALLSELGYLLPELGYLLPELGYLLSELG